MECAHKREIMGAYPWPPEKVPERSKMVTMVASYVPTLFDRLMIALGGTVAINSHAAVDAPVKLGACELLVAVKPPKRWATPIVQRALRVLHVITPGAK